MRCVDTNNAKRILKVVLPVLMVFSNMFSQNNKLIIQSGASFAGNGEISVKDSIRNYQNTTIPGRIALIGSDQSIVNEDGMNLQVGILSLRGNGVKTITGLLVVNDSLNVLSNTSLNIANSTLRILDNSANAGQIITNSNSLIEYGKDNGNEQLVMGGVYRGKIKLYGKSRKSLLGELTVDSIEHEGWAISVNNNLNINGKAEIDTLLNVNSGSQLTLKSDSSSIRYLAGNDGIIEVQSNGKLAFINEANNGIGTIRTVDGEIIFKGNVNSNGTLAITGNGVMSFEQKVSSTNYLFSPTSTVIYNGADQTIARANYGNLRLANSGTKMFSSGITGIAGTIDVENGAVADAITNSSIIDYNGTGAQVIAGLQYYDLRITNDRGGKQITLSAGDTIKVANVFNVSASNANYVTTDNVFEYNGALSQIIIPFEYYNLVLSGNGQKVISDSQTTLGNVEHRYNTPVVVNNGVIWNIQGSLITNENFINNGEINIGE